MQPHLNNGFTLIEMIVVLAVTTVVGLTLSGILQYFYRTNTYVLEQTAALENARRGLTESLALGREASYGDDGSYPVLSAATSSITFFADVDDDSGIERVRLYLSDQVLYRGVTNSAGNPPSYGGQPEAVLILADYVMNDSATPVFRYFDAAGAELSGAIDVAQVRTVDIEMRVDLNPLRAPNVYTLSGGATMRNLIGE